MRASSDDGASGRRRPHAGAAHADGGERLVGSPGVGVDDRGELGDGVEIWAAKAPGDRVPFLPGHGEDPSAEGFGARRFQTNGAGAPPVRGHSSYFATGSESLRNLALIMTGQDDLVSRVR